MTAKKTTKKVVKKKAASRPKAKVISKKIKNVSSHALRVGDLAPNFSLPVTSGGTTTLSSLRGKRVVLYFYPKDMTGGCTIEAHEFSKLAKKFAAEGTIIFGISPDAIPSHKKFITKEKITFPLLADVGHKTAEAYGVWIEKSMYGKKYMGIDRSTFVIGPDGTIEALYRKVKPEGHAVCVLEDLEK